jgi:hypothetical protein
LVGSVKAEMVRRPPINNAESGAGVGGAPSMSQNNSIDKQVVVVDTNTTAIPAKQVKSTKNNRNNGKSKDKLSVKATEEVPVPVESSSIPSSQYCLLQLQSDVGKLYALSKMMMKRMDFYEKQLDLFGNARQNAEQTEILASYQQQIQQFGIEQQTHTTSLSLLDQLTVQSHNLAEQIQLSQQWIKKLEKDRHMYQQRLSLTYEELRVQKVQQHRIQRDLQKVQWQYDHQLQIQNKKIVAAATTSNENGTQVLLPTNAATATATATKPSSYLVDDMMDSFYKEWSFNGQQKQQGQQQHTMNDGKTSSSSKRKKKKK